ncbi:hypothetical protein TKK_0011618 [Trichogramma kaykai]|uniref:BEN domain-containing protein n=1 Tax=Trichogramma kaykai TaxID=54128 RepID=A0ABD2WR59_9HYME
MTRKSKNINNEEVVASYKKKSLLMNSLEKFTLRNEDDQASTSKNSYLNINNSQNKEPCLNYSNDDTELNNNSSSDDSMFNDQKRLKKINNLFSESRKISCTFPVTKPHSLQMSKPFQNKPLTSTEYIQLGKPCSPLRWSDHEEEINLSEPQHENLSSNVENELRQEDCNPKEPKQHDQANDLFEEHERGAQEQGANLQKSAVYDGDHQEHENLSSNVENELRQEDCNPKEPKQHDQANDLFEEHERGAQEQGANLQQPAVHGRDHREQENVELEEAIYDGVEVDETNSYGLIEAFSNRTYKRLQKANLLSRVHYNEPHERFALVDGMIYLGCGVRCGTQTWNLTMRRNKVSLFARDLAKIIFKKNLCNLSIDDTKAQKQIPNRSPRRLICPRKFQLFLELCREFLRTRNRFANLDRLEHDKLMFQCVKTLSTSIRDAIKKACSQQD